MTYDPSKLTQEQEDAAWCRRAANAEAILFDALGLEGGGIEHAAEKIVEERDALREQLAAAKKASLELIDERDASETENITPELCERLCKLDDDFQKAYGPGDDKPDLLKLRSTIFRTLYRHMPELLDAWQWMQIAGGYHERTPREISIEQELNAGVAASESAERYLLDLVDAGRNRIHEEIGKREAAESQITDLKRQVEPLNEFARRIERGEYGPSLSETTGNVEEMLTWIDRDLKQAAKTALAAKGAQA